MVFEKRYDARKVENKWSKNWLNSGIYQFKKENKTPIYSIDTPPPTVSGELHMGHVYGYVQQDFTARFRRMIGYNVFYPFGFDDNGIATERFIEREKGVKAKELGRKKFSELCSEETKKIENLMKEMWIKLGISADWNYLYRTIDPKIWKISQRSFIELYKMGREYQKEGPIFWCPECSTAVSQVELEDKEFESYFNDLVFKLKDGKEIIVSTTRPELLPACVSIFVHPEDERYKDLVGKKAKVPLFDLEVPIMSDSRVDIEKGTGIVMCCTFGDQTDVEWYYAYNLPLRVAINEEGRMTELAGKYKGLKVKEARERIIKDLKEKGLLKGQKKVKHMVNTHERCGTEIEFLVSKQWFIKYLDLKKEFLKAGNSMNWFPEHMKSRYDNWIKGLQWDWCISRQRYNGIPFPVWYCKNCGEVILPDPEDLPVDPLVDKPKHKCPKCGSTEFIPEKDVLDTWATSSLTPLINAGWDGEKYNEKIFPMSLRPQGHDIISFWLFHTVAKSLLHTKKVPFKDVTINGWILDENGKKMSKSKGNIISPQKMMKDYSCDAIRFWCAGAKLGEDLPFRKKDFITGERFVAKIWNASRFASNFLNEKPKKPEKLNLIDKWIILKTDQLIKEVTGLFEKYEYSKVRAKIREVFWHLICDNYLEVAKGRLYSNKDDSAKYTLYNVLLNNLKLLSPVLPFVTEEIYHKVFKEFEKEKSITISEWPKPLDLVAKKEIKEVEFYGDKAIEIISSLRKFKSDKNLPLNQKLKKVTIFSKKDLEPIKNIIKEAMQVEEIVLSTEKPDIKEKIVKISPNYAKLGPKYGSLVKNISNIMKDPEKLNVVDDKLEFKVNGKKIVLSGDEFFAEKKLQSDLRGEIIICGNETLLIER